GAHHATDPNPRPPPAAARARAARAPPPGPTTPPVHTATTFARGADYQLPGRWSYGRPDNPTVEAAEAVLNSLEGGAGALLFGSGMAAATAAFQAALKPGDHVVAPQVMYWAMRKWRGESPRPWRVTVALVDMTH